MRANTLTVTAALGCSIVLAFLTGCSTDEQSSSPEGGPQNQSTPVAEPSAAESSAPHGPDHDGPMTPKHVDELSDDPTIASREAIGCLFAYDAIIDGTLRENLAIGNPGLDETAALALLSGLGLDDLNGFADKGMDLDVGEQGAHLSGGERQRLALVRALLRQTPIILLDEPTSSLDGKNELKFSQLLDQLSGARTIVVIAHRLQTIQRADRIYVLDHGRIEAAGQHDQLMSESSLYPQLMSTGDRHLS